MSDTFPRGPGVAQGPVTPGSTARSPSEVTAEDRPPAVPGQLPRPWPTDPGGTNDDGWMKTADYGDGYFGIDSGRWKQV
jgi:hypothetical protein